ncbi:outer membrane lipoprotein carrier protein LolA [uncultured Alistipes sp.]|uniref:LolA family protein n=1 Tax=uncultured Alistipes sp. TaxID=538949 RepID=UPI0025962FA9|nr:outer membrane lipoprotein carrier protein LolA [uncultured Alistipes sp.]
MKKLLVILGFLSGVCSASGQHIRQEEMVAAIDRSASSLKTMQCDFTQTRELSMLSDRMISHGTMYYQQSGTKFRWEYLRPYKYAFVLNGRQVMMQSSDRTDIMDTSANRIFREIAGLMMNTLTGKCLTDASGFTVRMSVEKDFWIAELTPVRRELSQFFACIRLYFDAGKQIVVKVEITDNNKDRTRIELKNIRTDIDIDESVFTVR